MPRDREDYGDYVASLALDRAADPFEVLGRSGGRRVTDNIEVFPEPVLDPVTRIATCHFLVRGVRHVPGAQDAIEHLTPGELLHVLNDPHNEYDTLALLLRTGQYHLVGYVPAFLTSVIHRSAEARSWEGVGIVVEHVGDRDGPVHLRLLCRLEMAWPFDEPPFAGPEFELMEPE